MVRAGRILDEVVISWERGFSFHNDTDLESRHPLKQLDNWNLGRYIYPLSLTIAILALLD